MMLYHALQGIGTEIGTEILVSALHETPGAPQVWIITIRPVPSISLSGAA